MRPPALRVSTRLVAPVPVRLAPARDPYEPTERPVGDAVERPGGGGRHEGLLHGVFGIGEMAVAADDDAEGLGGKRPQQSLDVDLIRHTSGSGALITCRTSMRCRIGAPP